MFGRNRRRQYVLHDGIGGLQVVMTQPGAPSAKSLDLTEEKRTAIQGAMKNIALDYMPQWAAALPEQAWIQALKGGEDR